VVDKGGIGWAGQTPLTGGMCIYVESNAVDEFVDSIIEKDDGLSNNDFRKAVVLSFQTRNIVISPAAPQAFIEHLHHIFPDLTIGRGDYS